MSELPHMEFNTASFLPEDRLDAVADLWRNYLAFKFHPRTRKTFFLSSNIWWLNDCTFVHSFAAPMTCRRPPSPQEESLISISYLCYGVQEYVLDGDLIRQSNDAVHVSNHSDQSLRSCPTDSEILILYVPRSRLGGGVGQVVHNRSFPTNSPVGEALRTLLLSLKNTVRCSNLAESYTLADRVCAFLAPVLRQTADLEAGATQDLRRVAIQQFIDNNIRDVSFDTALICKKFGMSRATLYRLFQDADGVKTYIARRKTELILSELSYLSPQWGLVRRVASKYGFDDMAHFNRIVRRHAGVTPGSLVGSLVRQAPTEIAQIKPTERSAIQRSLIFSNPRDVTHSSGRMGLAREGQRTVHFLGRPVGQGWHHSTYTEDGD